MNNSYKSYGVWEDPGEQSERIEEVREGQGVGMGVQGSSKGLGSGNKFGILEGVGVQEGLEGFGVQGSGGGWGV